jgi:hypothetical protein
MKYIPPVTKTERSYTRRGRTYTSHSYVDGNGTRIPGVTTILDGGIPKPQLIDWAANATAEGTLNHWDELANERPAARLAAMKEIRYEITNTAKNRGTAVHSYAERAVQGQPVNLTAEDEILRPYIENYVQFLDVFEVDPILIEAVLVHYGYGKTARLDGWAGTCDLLAELTNPETGARERWLLDIKTGEKGVFPETAIQLAAYRYAQVYLDDDGTTHPMIDVHACGAIHCTAESAQLIPTVSGPEQLLVFRHAREIYGYKNNSDGLIGAAIQAPSSTGVTITWGNP